MDCNASLTNNDDGSGEAADLPCCPALTAATSFCVARSKHTRSQVFLSTALINYGEAQVIACLLIFIAASCVNDCLGTSGASSL